MRPNNNPLNFGTYANPSTTLTLNANAGSIAQWATDIILASFQVVITGTPTGTLQAQASLDKAKGLPPEQFQPTNWSNIGTSVAVSAAGVYLVSCSVAAVPELSYEYIRLLYTDGSSGASTATMVGRFCSKGL